MRTLPCQTAAEVAERVAAAAAGLRRLTVVGRGSKAAWGVPVEADAVLDVSGLAGVVAYEPEELLLSVRPGTPLEEVQALLAERGQQLAFEPPDYGWVLSRQSAWGTIGGAVSVNASGPRRFRAGAARDHLLGVTAVSGLGETFRAGGRVVKNVTGYDLPKLLAGAFGTLGVLVELHLKVVPAPEDTATLVIRGLSDTEALEALGEVARSPHEATGLAHWPDPSEGARTVVRVEGFTASVAHRIGALAKQLGGRGETEVLDATASEPLWAAVRDGRPVADAAMVWLVSVPPTGALQVLEGARPEWWLLDHAGGRVWLGYDEARAEQAEQVRGALVQGGHATLLRAPEAVRRAVPVFQPRPTAHANLLRRVKEAMDPEGILEPGRMG